MDERAEDVDVLVGGVGQLYQGDLDLGRRAAERLATERFGGRVLVEDLYYGAIAVAQRLEDLRPHTLILIGAERRGRTPGTVERRRVEGVGLDTEEVGTAVRDAGTGYVTLGLVLEVAGGLDALPPRTVAIEVEPVTTAPSEHLSAEAATGLERALALVRAEVRRAPVLALVREIRATLADGHLDPSPALETMEALLRELDRLDRTGRWGATFRERDRLRRRIGDGATGEGMGHLDWGLWWSLVEELDRLQPLEAVDGADV